MIEAWELEFIDKMRRIRDDEERAVLEIPEGPCTPPRREVVPSIEEEKKGPCTFPLLS